MRKAAILTGFITVLSIFLIAGIFLTVKSQSSNIKITEERIAGDPAYAEGLSVEFSAADNMVSDNRWTVSYALQNGENPVVKAEFHKKILLSDSVESPEPYVRLAVRPIDGTYFTMAEAVNDYPFLAKALEAAAADTGSGKTCRKEFSLRDYAKNLPVEFAVEDSIKATQMNTDRSGKRNDFSHFSVPAPKDCKFSVEVEKNKAGEIVSVSLSDKNRCKFDSQGTFGKDGIYVSVTLPTQDGPNDADADAELVLPEKLCGIHFIPYEAQSENGKRLYYRLNMSGARLIYPMKEDAEVLKLMEYPDNRELIVIAKEHENTIVNFIDTKTMKLKQSLRMNRNISGSRLSSCRFFNQSLLLFTDKGSFALIRKKDKVYRALFGNFSCGGLKPAGLLLKGDTAVITAVSDAEEKPINHYLLICNETGTLYEGFYRFSLQSDTIAEGGSSVIQNRWEENSMIIRRRSSS